MEFPNSLQEAILFFSDEQVCIDAVAAMRWPHGPQCPDCSREHGSNPYYIKTQKRWKCRSCRRQFSVKLNTIFEDSAIPLQKWLPALWMLANDKNGISSHELSRALKITQKSAWFVLHRLRFAMKNNSLDFFKVGGAGNKIEVDESFIGGRVQNMHKDKRLRYTQAGARGGFTGKAIVQGILDRDLRQIRAKVMPDVKRETLQAEVLKNVKYGSNVYTDSTVAYDLLPQSLCSRSR